MKNNPAKRLFARFAVAFAVSVAPSPSSADESTSIYTCARADAASPESLATSRTIDAQDVSINFPAAMLCSKALENAVRAMVERYIGSSVRFSTELTDEERAETLTFAEEAIEKGFGWSHEMEVGQLFGNSKVVSLLSGVYSYTGGAHGNLIYRALVYDLASNEVVPLEALFTPGVPFLRTIATFVREDLYRQKRAIGSFIDEAGEDDFIERGTEPALENFEIYGIYGNAGGEARGLSFHFAPYYVGSFVEGEFSVKVPLVVFEAFLTPRAHAWFE